MTYENNSVELRLDKIEQSLAKIANMMGQAPNLMSMATDSMDDCIQNANQNGIDIDQRIKDGWQLLVRISDPKINTALNGLLDILSQSSGIFSMTIDSVDEGIRKVNRSDIGIDERIATVTHLISKLSEPQMKDSIDNLTKLVSQGPGLMAMTIDSFDAFMKRYHKEFSDYTSFLQKENLLFLKNAGDALTEAQSQPATKVGGIFGILKTLKDPSRQKALGFLMNVLKNLGTKI